MSSSIDYRKYAVLYVDDEEQALKYFKKALEKEFQVLTATNVADANAIFDREADKIAVLVTDQRMPNQTGVELLTRVRQKWPDVIRMLITAYSDMESAISAVNAGAIHRYITKPANLKELRDILASAIEQFFHQREQQTVLRERLNVLQRMVVADRVKSLATMAGGISHHLRNSMTALTCFLEEAAPAKAGEAPANLSADPKFAQELWTLAQKERENLVRIVQQVADTVLDPGYQLTDELGAEELARRGTATAASQLKGRSVTVSAEAGLPPLKVDAPKATQLLKLLCSYVARLGKADGKLSIVAGPHETAGAPGVRLLITSDGPDWTDADVASFFTPFAFPAGDPSDLGLDLLSAFTIAYHHGGDVLVHKAGPCGPGFELRLPCDPAAVRRPELEEQLMQKLFSRFDDASCAESAPTPRAA